MKYSNVTTILLVKVQLLSNYVVDRRFSTPQKVYSVATVFSSYRQPILYYGGVVFFRNTKENTRSFNVLLSYTQPALIVHLQIVNIVFFNSTTSIDLTYSYNNLAFFNQLKQLTQFYLLKTKLLALISVEFTFVNNNQITNLGRCKSQFFIGRHQLLVVLLINLSKLYTLLRSLFKYGQYYRFRSQYSSKVDSILRIYTSPKQYIFPRQVSQYNLSRHKP